MLFRTFYYPIFFLALKPLLYLSISLILFLLLFTNLLTKFSFDIVPKKSCQNYRAYSDDYKVKQYAYCYNLEGDSVTVTTTTTVSWTIPLLPGYLNTTTTEVWKKRSGEGGDTVPIKVGKKLPVKKTD